jgi:hypothetical protein
MVDVVVMMMRGEKDFGDGKERLYKVMVYYKDGVYDD